MTALASSTWPAVDGAELVLVPVGSIEQHGPHLPLETDTLIAVAVAEALAESGPLAGAWVAPPLAYAASGEHQAFPGTCSIGSDVLAMVIVELVRSLHCWAKRTVLVNAHGGNLTALNRAVEQLRAEGHDVTWVPCATEEVDLHAGRTETSLLLHLAPWHVRLDRAMVGNTQPLQEILPTLMASGVRAVSPSGILGDPTGASAAEGRAVMADMVRHIHRRLAGAEAHR